MLLNKLIRHIIVLIIVFLCTTSLSAKSGRYTNAIGIIVGNPTGLSIKVWDDGAAYVNTALGWSFNQDSYLYLHVDYIFQRYAVVTRPSRILFEPYWGFGAYMETKSDRFGGRLPLGINYNMEKAPIEFFIELVPQLDLIPATDFDLQLALAIRFVF